MIPSDSARPERYPAKGERRNYAKNDLGNRGRKRSHENGA